jgi:hypothetical protein
MHVVIWGSLATLFPWHMPVQDDGFKEKGLRIQRVAIGIRKITPNPMLNKRPASFPWNVTIPLN